MSHINTFISFISLLFVVNLKYNLYDSQQLAPAPPSNDYYTINLMLLMTAINQAQSYYSYQTTESIIASNSTDINNAQLVCFDKNKFDELKNTIYFNLKEKEKEKEKENNSWFNWNNFLIYGCLCWFLYNLKKLCFHWSFKFNNNNIEVKPVVNCCTVSKENNQREYNQPPEGKRWVKRSEKYPFIKED